MNLQRTLMLALIVAALGTSPDVAATSHLDEVPAAADTWCDAGWDGTCYFICAPGAIYVDVNGRYGGQDVWATAECDGDTVASCYAQDDFCEGWNLYDGDLVVGTCTSGPYNTARCGNGIRGPVNVGIL